MLHLDDEPRLAEDRIGACELRVAGLERLHAGDAGRGQEAAPTRAAARVANIVGEQQSTSASSLARRAPLRAKRSSSARSGAVERGDQGLPFRLTWRGQEDPAGSRPGRADTARGGRGSPRRPRGSARLARRTARSRRRRPSALPPIMVVDRNWPSPGAALVVERRAGPTRAPRARRWSRRRRGPRSRGSTTICASIQLRVLVSSGSSQRPPYRPMLPATACATWA